jgi:hypothetical protein
MDGNSLGGKVNIRKRELSVKKKQPNFRDFSKRRTIHKKVDRIRPSKPQHPPVGTQGGQTRSIADRLFH